MESLEAVGIPSCGINGKDGHTLCAKKKVFENGLDIGFVGEIENVNISLVGTLIESGYVVNISLVGTLIESGYVPVISPIGVDAYSQTYNINADYAASAIAGALGAQKLVFMTDVEGILKDKDDPSSIIRRMNVSEAKELIADGVISGGMIPKTECCMDALKRGVKTVRRFTCLTADCLIQSCLRSSLPEVSERWSSRIRRKENDKC